MKTKLLLVLTALMLVLLFAPACAEEAVFQPVDLPVVYLHIDGGQEEIARMNEDPQHSYRCTGMMDIIIPDGYSGEFDDRYPQESVQGLKMEYIHGRGNGSWTFSKRPYKIKLEEKADLFGLGKNKHWVLISNNMDNSQIRNWITNWVGEQMGLEFTPDGAYVELVMDGEYLGTYWLGEQIRTGKHRVNIDDLTEADTDLPAIQGGYLLEFRPDDPDGPRAFETEQGLILANITPSFDPEDGDVNEAQRNYIRGFIQKAEDAIWAEEGDYADYIDLQSLADYWWIMEFSNNADAFSTDSSHLFKPRYEADGSEGKLHFGPLWDFDEAWGNAEIETQQVKGFNHAPFIWMDQLRTRPEFLAFLQERWLVMDEKLEELLQEGGPLDQMASLLENAWLRDDNRWAAVRAEESPEVNRNFEREIAHIRSWIQLRREWINANMNRLSLLTFTFTARAEGMEDVTLAVPCDTWTDLADLEIPELDGKMFKGWATEDGTIPENDYLWMDHDITVTAVFE